MFFLVTVCMPDFLILHFKIYVFTLTGLYGLIHFELLLQHFNYALHPSNAL